MLVPSPGTLSHRNSRSPLARMPAVALLSEVRHFGVSRDVVKSWVRRGLVHVQKARFGRYDARWLEIDDTRVADLVREHA